MTFFSSLMSPSVIAFFCDYENNAITLGDMSDEKNVITVQLENGGCLKVNRDNIEDLSKAIAMFSPEDIRRILVALQQDAKVRQMQQEIEQDKIKQLLAER
jgi:shikimate kinase